MIAVVAVPAQYRGDVVKAARGTGLPVAVVACQINEESGFQPDVVSPTGAEGIAQFEPGTWADLGCAGSPFNPSDAFACYTRYMRILLHDEGGSVRRALAAYNAGPGNVPAGLGYAGAILSCAGASPGLQAGGGSVPGAAGGPHVPNWAPKVTAAGRHHASAAKHLLGYAAGVARIRPVLTPPKVTVPQPQALLWAPGKALPRG